MSQRWKTWPWAKPLKSPAKMVKHFSKLFKDSHHLVFLVLVSVKMEIIGMPLFDILSLIYFDGMFKELVTQLCLTLCHPIDCSPPGSSAPGILQARTLEWIAIPLSSWPGDRTLVSCIRSGFFTILATREAVLGQWWLLSVCLFVHFFFFLVWYHSTLYKKAFKHWTKFTSCSPGKKIKYLFELQIALHIFSLIVLRKHIIMLKIN